ncbi:MAG: hypothetical protein HF308_18290 [Ignavibacteria bacterium]|jgi:hypothetical protein|nr:hypothetical protein [Ignavibacteria bacterium]
MENSNAIKFAPRQKVFQIERVDWKPGFIIHPTGIDKIEIDSKGISYRLIDGSKIQEGRNLFATFEEATQGAIALLEEDIAELKQKGEAAHE